MLKGFAITPVVLGRISLGGMVEKNGKKIPVKRDYMEITSNTQKDGSWIPHPVAARLADAQKGRLLSIPVRIMFDSPDNNFRAQYTCFDDKGRTLCTGDGDQSKRRDPKSETGVSDHACPGSDRCSFGKENRCKPYGRLLVGIEEIWQADPLAGFMLRTTSWNSIRALTARLSYFQALTGGKLAGMPCNLVLRAKSTTASMRQPIYYVDLEPRGNLASAFQELKQVGEAWEQAGINREELDKAVSAGYAQSAFVEPDEDGEEIVGEFFHGDPGDGLPEGSEPQFGSGTARSDANQASGATLGAASQTDATASPPAVTEASSTSDHNTTDSLKVPVRTPAQEEAEKKAVGKAITNLLNIMDEKGLDNVVAWAEKRFDKNPEAQKQVKDAIEERRKVLLSPDQQQDGRLAA